LSVISLSECIRLNIELQMVVRALSLANCFYPTYSKLVKSIMGRR